ncbi:class I SAM-dependent methyltransferase [Paenibacillus puldeungensis]|uniref:Class I SAM-dependent methyltransferase n=1 Tax=Paenibacillus puldeungensis TaxID=696536 RepID=A0ABW3RVY6_9BACL
MNKIWSSQIQGPKTLDLSRELRFRDDRKEFFVKSLGLLTGMTVVDLGCGPGTLTRKLAKWLGNESKIIGIDRDDIFIDYAKNKALEQGFTNIEYLNGNIMNIPLESDSVDACTSHTVIEHVPNYDFLLEQKRICKSGGIVSVMSARPEKAIKSLPSSAPQISEREKELWEPINQAWLKKDQERGVGSYAIEPSQFPHLFEQLGFVDIEIDSIALPVVIDNSSITFEERLLMVEYERQQAIDCLVVGLNQLEQEYEHAIELELLINNRFDKRKEMVMNNQKIWDFQIHILLIARGRKP